VEVDDPFPNSECSSAGDSNSDFRGCGVWIVRDHILSVQFSRLSAPDYWAPKEYWSRSALLVGLDESSESREG
jgi:hypothetical protein